MNFLTTLALLIIIFGLCKKNDNYSDIRPILSEHRKLLQKNWLQCILFYGAPILLSLGTTMESYVTAEVLDNLNIIVSLLLSMLFAMLGLTVSFKQNGNKQDEKYQTLINQTFNTVLYECIICIEILLLSLLVTFSGFEKSPLTLHIFSIIIYFLAYSLLLQVFIILKRIRALFLYN